MITLAIKFNSVTFSQNRVVTGECITISVNVEDVNWDTIKNNFLDWNEIRTDLGTWNSVLNYH